MANEHYNRRKTHCPLNHPYDEANTRVSSTGARICKVCNDEAKRQHRLGARRRAIKKLGGKCVECGITDERVLHIDHINGGGGADRKKRGSYAINLAVLRGEPGFQLLCANHHAIKTWEDRRALAS